MKIRSRKRIKSILDNNSKINLTFNAPCSAFEVNLPKFFAWQHFLHGRSVGRASDFKFRGPWGPGFDPCLGKPKFVKKFPRVGGFSFMVIWNP